MLPRASSPASFNAADSAADQIARLRGVCDWIPLAPCTRVCTTTTSCACAGSPASPSQHHQSHPHRNLVSPGSYMETLSTLPTEILLVILENLSPDERLKTLCDLRASCRQFHHRFTPHYISALHRTCEAEGTAPLCVACEDGNLALVRLLLQHDGAGTSSDALHIAINGENTEIVQALLEAGAAGAVDALHLASTRTSTAMVQVLLAWGVDVNAPSDGVGETALHLAMHTGKADIAQLLVDWGADVQARTRPGATPLHIGASMQSTNAVKVLLEAGADVNARKETGETPLFECMRNPEGRRGTMAMVKLLLQWGAEMQLRDHRGRTPLDLVRRMRDNRSLWSRDDWQEVLQILAVCDADHDCRWLMREWWEK